MPDRLSELARQRALVSEHLAWLDREIANETVKRGSPAIAAAVTPPSAPAAPVVAATAASTVPTSPVVGTTPTEGEQILEQYRVEPTSLKQDVRKGCLLYFAAAFVLLGLVVVILYFSIGTRQ